MIVPDTVCCKGATDIRYRHFRHMDTVHSMYPDQRVSHIWSIEEIRWL